MAYWRILGCVLVVSAAAGRLIAQELVNEKHVDATDRFAQIDSWLPTPNAYRTASGAPGPSYWQQLADYDISVTLDDLNRRILGDARITYHNRSPDPLRYVWVQLDQNRFRPDSIGQTSQTAPQLAPRTSFQDLESILALSTFQGGFQIESVTDGDATPLSHVVVDTMMRIDLPTEMPPGGKAVLRIKYRFNIVDATVIRARGGYEYFKDDDNCIYQIAQWYPRVCAYTDYAGWQHKQFMGRGEFTLELGNYVVRITAPKRMIVAATGELQNATEALSPVWIDRLRAARTADQAVYIVTPDEAIANASGRDTSTKTWIFKADSVRDFAFAASRKFIWDAIGTRVGDDVVMAMSYYPGEAQPLWSRYSTQAIVHTLEVYGRYAFPYPYPIAISVNGPVYGMEYPMICFNGPRGEPDGTYSPQTKYGLISVIIHEVGHNFFPMIVNSDERQWTWMDEGINTFLQYLAEQEWEPDYPSRRGEPEDIVPFMRGGNQRPIMTGSEELLQFGENAYAKPATALNILRETVLGRETFDFAFREYARRWRFKRPTPADFFRTMEDASGSDLDWFWRGWFYSTDHVDIAIRGLRLFQIDDGDPDAAADRLRVEKDAKEKSISDLRNRDLPKRTQWQPGLKDFYNSPDYDEDQVDEEARKSFRDFLEGLDEQQRLLLRRQTNFYVASFENIGGLVMPIILRIHYDDSTSETITIPAQIWRLNSRRVDKLLITEKEIVRLELDPRRQTADAEPSNNHWPEKIIPSRFQLFKEQETKRNAMQKAGLGDTPAGPSDSPETPADADAGERSGDDRSGDDRSGDDRKTPPAPDRDRDAARRDGNLKPGRDRDVNDPAGKRPAASPPATDRIGRPRAVKPGGDAPLVPEVRP